MNAILYLEDGTLYEGKGFGKEGLAYGEMVFNTAMTGYQEILTDPSYAGQIVTMTYPLIGNYGVNKYGFESKRVHARGLVVKYVSKHPSNYLSEGDLNKFLCNLDVVGIYDIDTRSLTKKIRTSGAMKSVIATGNYELSDIKSYINKVNIEQNYVEEVSTKEIIKISGNGHKVAVLDFGIKNNILENIKERNCDITVFPYNSTVEDIMSINPEGVLLSNGPGDPKCLKGVIENVKEIIKYKPTFGICLGHQILSLALGGDTYKMKYGHHGANHGVYDIERDRAYITSQNHSYAVDGDSLKDKDMMVTHINLNDNTIEGMKHKHLPIFSVQFHPEGAPGPVDSAYLFDNFIESMSSKRSV